MRKIDIDELKIIQLDILDCFDSFCKKNNLHYWLDYGTLLGAVRHCGYIPWDDDLDIGMLRKDYEVASRLFNQQSNNSIAFLTPQNKSDYRYPFGKLINTNTILYEYGRKGIKTGVYVDVFPYDNCPSNDEVMKRIFRKRDRLGRMRRLQLPMRREITGLKKAVYVIGSNVMKITSNNWVEKALDNNAKKFESIESEYVCDFVDPYDSKRLKIPKKLFTSFVDVQFESGKYPAPLDYDFWLRNYYGDYMTLPPIEERIGHHVFEAYYIEPDDVNNIGRISEW